MFHNLDAVLQIMEYIVLLIGTVIYKFSISQNLGTIDSTQAVG